MNFRSDLNTYDLNAEYRRDLMRDADNMRLARLVRRDHPLWQRSALRWVGTRLIQSGVYLTRLANDVQRADGASKPSLEQAYR